MPSTVTRILAATCVATLVLAGSAGAAPKPSGGSGSAVKKAKTVAKRADAKATAAGAAAAQALAAAAQAQAAAGTASAGVAGLTTTAQRLAAVLAADEHGVVQIAWTAPGSPAGTLPTPVDSCFYESGDIPDDGQGALVTATCLVPNTVPAGSAVRILAGIRSNEDDGVTTPAGVAAVLTYAQSGTTVANQGAGTANVNVITPTGSGSTVAAVAGGVPAVAINQKSPPTSATERTYPYALIATDRVVDLATTQFSGTPSVPVYANPATTPNRTVAVTIRFNDLSINSDDPAA